MTKPHATLPQLSAQDIARFSAKVDTSGDCWLWQGGRFTTGYGHFTVSGKLVGAHRVAYQLAHGPIPLGLLVCHTCDNPQCVRPDHLFLGTVRDNALDAQRKSRLATGDRNGARTRPERKPRGEAHWVHRFPERVGCGTRQPRAVLTDEAVRTIRALSAKGVSGVALAKQFGVSATKISRVIRRLDWRHVQ